MANAPMVSVVVPVYNAEPYIKKCVDSILQQTLRNFEIILIDDASTDGTYALCQKLYGGNDKIKFLQHTQRMGVTTARNTGMKFAKGRYVCFVNGEDFLLPSALKKFYAAAEKFNADVVHAAGHFELEPTVESAPKGNLQLTWDKYSQDGLIKKSLLYKMNSHWISGATDPSAYLSFYRREFLQRWNLSFLNLAAADELFLFALFCLTERYCVLYAAFYVKRKMSDDVDDCQKFFDGLRAMIVGSIYIGKFLDKVPRFDSYALWRENILATFFNRVMLKYTTPHYKNILADATWNEAADKTLKPLLPHAASFMKYFVDTAHTFRRQAELNKQTADNLLEQTLSIFKRMDISRRKIVFANFNGGGYGCNPKYIAEEILRQKLPFDLVWLVNDLKAPMPEKIRKVQYGTLDSMFEIASARVIVTNTKKLLPFPGKKQGQFFIMTWHSGLDFKRVEQDAEKNLSPAYVRESKATSEMTDLMLANTQTQFEEFSRSFWYSGEILKCGLPRNDIFFRRDEKLAARVKKNLGVPRFSKIVLYAPTHRDNASADIYRLNVKKILDALENKFGGEWTILMRLHPDDASAFASDVFGSENVINATNYSDVQELILIADALISDYSSVIFDGMCAGKKIFICAKDFDAYTNERGLKPLYFDLPYKINRSEAELLADIETFDAAVESRVKNFIAAVQPFNTGHAAADVVALIKAAVDNA